MTSVLTTERLTLRPWRMDEAPVLLSYRGDPEVTKWLGNPAPWEDVARAEQAIAEWQLLHDGGNPLGQWAIVPTGSDLPVGDVTLHRIADSNEVGIGWTLHPNHVGHGWASEAALNAA